MQAFVLLSKRLKPLEQMGSLHNEFKDLCYLLTCKSIQDAPFFKSWEGIASSRYVLVNQTCSQFRLVGYAHCLLSQNFNTVEPFLFVHLKLVLMEVPL